MNITEVILTLLKLNIPVKGYEYASDQEQNKDTGLTSGNPMVETMKVTVSSNALPEITSLTKILTLAFDKNKVEKIQLELFDGNRSISTLEFEGALLNHEESYMTGSGLTIVLTFSVKTIDAHKAKFSKVRSS